MKTNVQIIKDEPIEIQNYSTKTVNKLLHLYSYDQIKKSKTNSSKDSLVNQEPEPSTCAWCQKLGGKSFTLYTDNGDSKTLCSEVCFNQYRRASFKKNKDSKLSKTHPTSKIKSTNCTISEKKSKSTINETEHNHHQDTNRRKISSPYHHSSQTKTKTHEFSRNLSPSASLPLSKRHRSSSSNEKTSSNLPRNLNYLSSLFLPPPPSTVNPFQYPFFIPPPPPPPPVRQMPISLPLRTTSSEHVPSTLFPTLTKGLVSNYTCILPTFIPLPILIPIPLCFPIHSPCVKDVINQECQTELQNTINSFPTGQKQARRMSI